MTQQREQKITVKPDTLNNLVSAVERGEYRIPHGRVMAELLWFASVLKSNDSGADALASEEDQGG